MARYGLFVGINLYENGITPLKCARNDVLALSRIFSTNGYEVVSLLDSEASETNIRAKLRTFRNKLKNEDIFLFYFSGHGCEVNHNHYLIGQTAYPDGIAAGEGVVALERIRELTDIPGVRRLFVLDCCRNNIYGGKAIALCPESRDIALGKISKFKYKQSEIIHPLIVTSCSTGERSYENETSGRGYFTQILESSLESKAVNSFTSFRIFLANEMKNLQMKQTLCWYGNVDAWEDFKLVDSWTPSVIQHKSESVTSSSTETKLTFKEDRMEFYNLIFELDNKFASIPECHVSKKIYTVLNEFQKNIKELKDCAPTQDNIRKLKQLKSNAEQIERDISGYYAYRNMTEKLVSIKEFLSLHNVLPNQESIDWETRAQFAERREDFEIACKLFDKARAILSQQQTQLTDQLNRIAELKSEIEKTKAQLSGSDNFKSCDSSYMEQLEQYESKKDYNKVRTLLEEILSQDKKSFCEQTKCIKNINELQKAVKKLEDKFSSNNIILPEYILEAKRTAVQSFEQKKYNKAETQWQFILETLQKINLEYDSFLMIKTKVEEWEQTFPEEKETISDEIKILRDNAMAAEIKNDFHAAKFYWEKFIQLSEKHKNDAIEAMYINFIEQNKKWCDNHPSIYDEGHEFVEDSEYDKYDKLNWVEKVKYKEELAQERISLWQEQIKEDRKINIITWVTLIFMFIFGLMMFLSQCA